MNQQCCHLRLSCRSLDIDKLARKARVVKSDSDITDFYTLLNFILKSKRARLRTTVKCLNETDKFIFRSRVLYVLHFY